MALILAALALSLSSVAHAAEQSMLDLGDGYKFELLDAGDSKARAGNPKVIFVKVAFSHHKPSTGTTQLIEAADRVFESVLMGAAEKGYYKRAVVHVRTAAGESFDAFTYVRGENEVWLRQAGPKPWMTAQDPAAWMPPAAQKVEVQGFGMFAVEAALEITPPEGFRRAAEIDFVTSTSLADLQRKFQETKALWARIDRDQMRKDGFDLVLIGNFASPQRGRFHARRGFFVQIPRDADGPWPELPASVPEEDALLVSQNTIEPEQLADLIRSTFAVGLGKPAPAPGQANANIAHAQWSAGADLGLSQITSAIRANPKPVVIKIP